MKPKILAVLSTALFSGAGSLSFATNANDGIDGENNNWETMLFDFPSLSPTTLGQGWKLADASKTDARCIDFHPVTLDYNDKKISYRTVVDNESLAKSLDISASASFKSIALVKPK